MKTNSFIYHMFLTLFSLIAFGLLVVVVGLVWFGALVVWNYIF